MLVPYSLHETLHSCAHRASHEGIKHYRQGPRSFPCIQPGGCDVPITVYLYKVLLGIPFQLSVYVSNCLQKSLIDTCPPPGQPYLRVTSKVTCTWMHLYVDSVVWPEALMHASFIFFCFCPPPSNEDHTEVHPGKWSAAELQPQPLF